jgi:uncharacterized coiled-coil protein SlyX
MRSTKQIILQARIDDYLDLYNYAKLLGDVVWQQEIINKLSDQALQDEEVHYFILQELWNRFETINRKLIALHQQLKDSNDTVLAEQIKEQMWELKLQRVAITRKIYANC